MSQSASFARAVQRKSYIGRLAIIALGSNPVCAALKPNPPPRVGSLDAPYRRAKQRGAALALIFAHPREELPNEIVDRDRRRWLFRHPLTIRLTHWLNVLCMTILLMSGLQIFNARPDLYLGKASNFDAPILSMSATNADPQRGVTQVFGHCVRHDRRARPFERPGGSRPSAGFPSWITLPADQDLATGRRWHFLFAWIFVANGLIYLGYGLLSGELRLRLIPSLDQIRGFGHAVWEHLTLRFPKGEEAKRYNVIQKLTYLVVVLGLLPLQILAGLAMSPGFDAIAPWVLDLFGGRQTARTVHFILAGLLVLFVAVHVVMVIVSGVWNNLRGMISGWFVIEGRSALRLWPSRRNPHG